ncbi:MAG: twin-arginine translocation pathway signal [Hyphomicrobiaceae bacterium]
MNLPFYNRRTFLVAAGSAGAALASGPLMGLAPALAQGLEPTKTMSGGSNNYRPNAPVVERLGAGGFLVSGRVLKASDGTPLKDVRIQIWAATTVGGEPDPRNHGSVITAADGTYRLDMPQIVPYFGQPHAHLAYDDKAYQTVFLRPLLSKASDTSLKVDFVLASA